MSSLLLFLVASLQKHLWIVIVFSSLMSTALLVVSVCQYQVFELLSRELEKPPTELEALDDQLSNLLQFEMRVERLLNTGEELVDYLEASVLTLGPDMEQMRADVNTCQTEMKIRAAGFTVKEAEVKQAQALFKTESDIWNQEISSLKAQLTGRSPICDYMRSDTNVLDICGTAGEPTA